MTFLALSYLLVEKISCSSQLSGEKVLYPRARLKLFPSNNFTADHFKANFSYSSCYFVRDRWPSG